MLNIKEVIKVVNTVIIKNSKEFQSSITIKDVEKPQYNAGLNQFKVCSLNHISCKEFYKNSPKRDLWERQCPFGFTVTKKSFNTSTSYEKISIFSVINHNQKHNYLALLNSLPRKIKQLREEAIYELKDLSIDNTKAVGNKKYLEKLLETLLIGRIGLSIQSLSHEFFTPLQGAMNDVKNIQGSIDIIDSIKRLQKNFNSLNKYATEIQFVLSTSDQFSYNMLRRVTVHTMVDDIFDNLFQNAKDKNIELKQGFNTVKTVDAIPTQFYIVLSNIISNAVKYSYKGYVGKTLNVSVNYEEFDDNLIIIISNEGCKITQEEIKNNLLFNLGYRGDFSGDRQRPGSGSGLFISNEIVKIHGGSVDVSSSFCGGSVENETDRYKNIFKINWPIIIEEDYD